MSVSRAALAQAPIGVSVLCTAFVNTGIADAARNRPAELSATNPLASPYAERVRKAVHAGRLSAAQIARATLDAVHANRFYVLPHANVTPAIEQRMREIVAGLTPTNPMP